MDNQLKNQSQITDANAIIQVMEELLSPQRISAIEIFIVKHSLLGYTYHEMANISSYTTAYIKEIGSQLWQDLSTVMGRRITKKNLNVLLNKYKYRTNQDDFTLEQFSPEIKVKLPRLSVELLQFPDGSLSLDSPYYIKHPSIEDQIFAELQQPGCVIRIKAPRHFGKTSLLHRLSVFAQEQEFKSVYLDFQEADETIFACLNQFLRWFCSNITQKLALPVNLNDYWDEEIGSKVSCRVYFEKYLLPKLDCPLVLLLDEVNRIFEHSNIALDFLPMLRAWHEQAKNVRIWQKLRLVVAHATEVYVPLRLNQSPFNVGLLITLPQFTIAQVQELAACYALNWYNHQRMQNAMFLRAMVGGHPYLTHLALHYLYLQKGEITLEKLLETAPTQTGIYRHYLQNLLVILEDELFLKDAFCQVVMRNEGVQLNALTAYKLESLGLIQLQGDLAYVSCQLYRLYFRQQLQCS
ncbi:MAG: AAA-like domain-containing protein [Nostoc sp. S4]|nr:AAA-like domain-containing protein [Nostoc sp. S4]